ncbi:hypothetical protein AB835_03690 [Candidatus Endobugula sertula]|uniref:Co-chaperone DjlA N-terminal domain-containing protein n=1 Tax=Candidatus Endobugula sertula TaxID=62101 RepID=A0A1D2QS57_9GAMM|nr:hypothetical protein AB835_03690 [Candidatus Endobugula sertula]
MISRLQQLLSQFIKASPDEGLLSDTNRQLATAALLVEVATIDQQVEPAELSALHHRLSQQFSLADDEIKELINNARSASKESSSLYQFTQHINQHCSDDEKYQLACDLWHIAYADGNLDKYEEYIIRRITHLIHLRHSDFIRAKHQARDKLN